MKSEECHCFRPCPARKGSANGIERGAAGAYPALAMDFNCIPRRSFWLVSVVLLWSVGGCAGLGGQRVHADLSTPKSAALAYLTALQHADAKTAHATSAGSPDERQWVDALIAMIDGMRQFNDSLYSYSWPGVYQVHVDLHDALNALADEPVDLTQQGTARIQGEEAMVEPLRKDKGFTAKFQQTIWLLHDPKGWKVNLRKTYATNIPLDRIAEVTAHFRGYQRGGDAFRAAARDVRAGRFHSTMEAERALGERMKKTREGS